MSTTTAPPTTRQLANRLRSTLEWIDAHADVLPGGWVIDSRTQAVEWHRVDGPVGVALAALVDLLGVPPVTGAGKRTTWAEWPAEGGRPRLTVYLGGPVPATTGGSECNVCAKDRCACSFGGAS